MINKHKQLIKVVDDVFDGLCDQIADILEVDRKKLKVFLEEVREDKEKLNILNRILFDGNTGKIILNNKECFIPFKTNQYYLCKELFGAPFGKRINEIDIMGMDVWKESTNRSVYDAVRLVNAKMGGALGVKDFIKWQKNTVWKNDEYSHFA